MRKSAFRQETSIPFFKIHGAGNDCLVFAHKDLPLKLQRSEAGRARFVKAISHRNLGLGSDQVLEVLSRRPLSLQIWNCDGSKAEMCANGSRTFASLAHHLAWVPKNAKSFPLLVSGKAYEAFRVPGKAVNFELSLGTPVIEGFKSLRSHGAIIPCTQVNVGNPHAVIFLLGAKRDWKPKNFDYRLWGARLETHRAFPKKANIEFVRKIYWGKKQATVELECWERGAGATLSCGSGAVAAARAIQERFPEKRISDFALTMNGFTLRVRFQGAKAFLSGPTALTAQGHFYCSAAF